MQHHCSNVSHHTISYGRFKYHAHIWYHMVPSTILYIVLNHLLYYIYHITVSWCTWPHSSTAMYFTCSFALQWPIFHMINCIVSLINIIHRITSPHIIYSAILYYNKWCNMVHGMVSFILYVTNHTISCISLYWTIPYRTVPSIISYH